MGADIPIFRWYLLNVLCAWSCTSTSMSQNMGVSASREFIPFGLQSGSDNAQYSSFATSMAYDDRSRELTITGGTYSSYFKPGESETENPEGSDCFVAILHLPHPTISESFQLIDNSDLSWVRRRQFGTSSASEFCSAVHLGQAGNILAVGHSNEGGILSPLLPHGDDHRSIYGMIMDLDDGVELKGGMLLHSNAVQYPVSLDSDPSSQDLYVAEIFSDDDPVTLQMDYGIFRGGADLSVTGYHSPLFDMRFSVRIQKFAREEPTLLETRGAEPIVETLHAGWSREFGTVGLENVQLSVLSYLSSSALLMAGFTTGSGSAFSSPSDPSLKNMDGFITVLDPSTGNVVQSMRIGSLEQSGDDRILGVCRHNSTESTEIYVVGMTDGIFDSTHIQALSQNDVHAFLMKIDLNRMEVVWSRQLGGIFPEDSKWVMGKGPQVQGMACAVTLDGEEVYMAGNVMDGAVLSIINYTEFESFGINDIFVSKFRSEDGMLEFAKQIGSSDDDTLAHGNCLATDEAGNLIVLGNTRGSLYRKKANTGISDIFTMSISREDGDFVPPIELQEKKGTKDDKYGERLRHKGDGSDPVQTARYNNAVAALGTLLGLAVLLVGVALLLRQRRLRTTETTSVEKYLDGSDGSSTAALEEQSVTGGWQATSKPNSNDSAHGRSRRSDRMVYEESPAYLRRSYQELNNPNPVLSTIGQYKAADRYKTASKSNEEKLRKSSRIASKGLKGAAEEDPYGDVYDLLTLASKRLSLEEDNVGKEGPQRVKKGKKERKYREPKEHLTLDNVWETKV